MGVGEILLIIFIILMAAVLLTLITILRALRHTETLGVLYIADNEELLVDFDEDELEAMKKLNEGDFAMFEIRKIYTS